MAEICHMNEMLAKGPAHNRHFLNGRSGPPIKYRLTDLPPSPARRTGTALIRRGAVLNWKGSETLHLLPG